MALWFSASAIVPSLTAEFHLSPFAQAALTSGVQVGFVIGCLASAAFGLADRLDPRRFFAVATVIGAAANLLLLAVDPASMAALALRVVTGICMAGIYPVGMKLAATWAKGDMGLMVGILVGALTLGSAAPHLFNAFGGMQWRVPLVTASASALVAAASDRLCRHRPQSCASPALRSKRCADRVARCSAAPRQPGLSRPHVGALRDVGVDRRVLQRELCLDVAAPTWLRWPPSWPRSRRSPLARSAPWAPDYWPTALAGRRSRSRRWR